MSSFFFKITTGDDPDMSHNKIITHVFIELIIFQCLKFVLFIGPKTLPGQIKSCLFNWNQQIAVLWSGVTW